MPSIARYPASGGARMQEGILALMQLPKTVAGVDGRMWSVRRNIEWSVPATGDDFEHDVGSPLHFE